MPTEPNDPPPDPRPRGDWSPTVELPRAEAETLAFTATGPDSPTQPATGSATLPSAATGSEATTQAATAATNRSLDATATFVGTRPAPERDGGPTEAPATGLDQYTALSPAGRWKFGDLFDAEHKVLGRKVRLRKVDPATASDDARRADFLAMVRSVALFHHPQVDSGVFEAVGDGPDLYLAAEPPRGEPLAGLGLGPDARRRSRSWLYPNPRLGRCLLEAATGLAALHDAGLAHGHIRPEHLRYDHQAHTLRLGGLGEPPADPEAPADDPKRRDLHDLAASFAEILAGRHPLPRRLLAGAPARKIARAILRRNPWASRELVDLIARSMAGPGNPRAITSADELARAVATTLERRTYLAGSADRYITSLYDGLILVLTTPIMVLALFGLERLFPEGVLAANWSLLSHMIVMVAAYFGASEFLLGTTPGRAVRGLRLIDPSGGDARRPRLLARFLVQASLTWALAASFAAGLNRFLPAGLDGRGSVSTPDPFARTIGGGPEEVALALALAYLGLQVASFLHPRKRPLHDALTSTTWGLRLAADPVRLGLQPPRAEAAHARPEQFIGRLDQFLLVRELGRGGMGTVFEAWDDVLHRRVAIKQITPALEAGGTTLRRFEQEAYLAAQISHPNVARLFAVGWAGGRPYLVMELIEGEDLHQRVDRLGPMPVARAWDCIAQAARGLREAHRLGIVHRDIKPSNLMIARDGTVKVMDFGISKLIGGDPEPAADPERTPRGEPSAAECDAAAVHLTRTGALIGTPRFMSPEQAVGRPTDAQSDIYSLGLTLFHLLAGHPPFDSRDLRELVRLQCSAPLPPLPLEAGRTTPDQRQMLDRMTAKDPADRPNGYDDLLAELAETAPKRARLATLLPRAWAFLLDASLATLPLLAHIGLPDTPLVPPIVACSSLALLGLFGWLLARKGTSLGKWVAGVRVVRRDGRPVGWPRAMLRLAITFPTLYAGLFAGLPSAGGEAIRAADLLGLLLALSALLVALTPARRAVHDYLAGTVVILVPRPIRWRRRGLARKASPDPQGRSTGAQGSVGGSESSRTPGRSGSSPAGSGT